MKQEILTCPLQNFLTDYLPFSPSPQWVDTALRDLKTQGTLVAGKCLAWDVFPNPPSEIDGEEPQVFKLEDIFEKLGEVDFPGNSRNRKFHYKNWSNQEMQGETAGFNFKADGIIVGGRNSGKEGPISVETAMAMVFKKNGGDEDIYENHNEMVSAAVHIMNDDPRRGWMYGITIEDTEMSLWYFSRSHSVKSATFDFTKDIETCIRVFLTFLFATPQELGYDATIHRVRYEEKWCYVYELGTKEAPRYFRTTGQLYNRRVLCITGRKPRVWRAVEIEGPRGDQLGQVKDGAEVAVKDLWLDEGSRTEGELQQAIFERLEGVKEEDYEWAFEDIKDDLGKALGDYKGYLMEIKHDRLLEKTKPVSKAAKPDPDPLEMPESASTADSTNLIEGSTQTEPPHYNPPTLALKPVTSLPREYKVKQHYRLVYRDVGHTLHRTTSLPETVTAIYDAFIGLVLLHLAGWVHRDVSTGNIILVKQSDGSFRGKLSDLEYAQDFNSEDRKVSRDPQTGTPNFMPVEIQQGKRLYIAPPTSMIEYPSNFKQARGNVSKLSWTSRVNTVAPVAPLKFIFPHDLESLFWIILWVFLCRIKYKRARKLAGRLFTSLPAADRSRMSFFTQLSVEESIRKSMHPDLPPQTSRLIDDFRSRLLQAFLKENLTKSDLQIICNNACACLCFLVDAVNENPGIELVDHTARVPTDDDTEDSSSSNSSSDTEASSSAPEDPPTDDDDSDYVDDGADEDNDE